MAMTPLVDSEWLNSIWHVLYLLPAQKSMSHVRILSHMSHPVVHDGYKRLLKIDTLFNWNVLVILCDILFSFIVVSSCIVFAIHLFCLKKKFKSIFFSHFSRMNSVELSSVPSIPNPFPELCSPSQSPVLIGSLSPPRSDTHVRSRAQFSQAYIIMIIMM